jgi:hypothetical protein
LIFLPLALALICKRFNELATPIIYAEYSGRPRNLNPFLANPSLWAHIQKIEFPWSWEISHSGYRASHFPLLPMIEKFELQSVWHEKLFQEIIMGSGAGIMCQTKNVMDIRIGVVDDNYVVYTLPSLHCTTENWLPL